MDGRELLKRSVHLATLCYAPGRPPLEEQRLWTMACSYVKRAQQLIPSTEWSRLTELERTILHHGVPHPMPSTFFEEEEPNDILPLPAPSTWEKIQDLKSQIHALEQERETLIEGQTDAQAWRAAYAQLDANHEAYRARSQAEQVTFQAELQHLGTQLTTAHEHEQDMIHWVDKMRQKIALIHAHNHQEMTQLRIELDDVRHERETLAATLNEKQTQLNEKQAQLGQLAHSVQTLQEEVAKYQDALRILVPLLDADLRDELRELLL